jgi:uncharacterized C2H2 Zn-finger protein
MVEKEKVKCDVCGRLFSSRKQLQQHTQDLHAQQSKDIKPARKPFKFSNARLAIIGVAVIAVAVGVGAYLGSAQNPSSTTPLTIDGIQCNSNEQLLFHIHAHLDIYANGQPILVPAQIGIIPDKCFYWLHTHDETGVIHIESPVARFLTLGQFFDIWNKKFNNNQVLDNVVNSNSPLSVYINGTKVVNGKSYRDIILTPHEEIAIVYGTQPSLIPSSYNFPNGL